MRALARLLTLSLLLGWLAGCASWGEDTWRQPEVHLVKVEKVRMHLHQQEFVLHLQVDNPNDERLFIRTIDYSVHLGDLLLAQDEVSLWRSVGGHARRTFKITARTNLWQHLKPWPSCCAASSHCNTTCAATWLPACSSIGTCTCRAVVR